MRALRTYLIAVAIVALFLIPASPIVNAMPDSETGYDGAWFVNDPYKEAKSMTIGYTHWDYSTFSITLKDPSGNTKQTWTPGRNYPSVGYLTYSLANAVSGDWHLYMQSTTSGTSWDHAQVRYYVLDFDTGYFDDPNNTARRVAGFSTFDCSSGKVGLGISYELAVYGSSPNRHLTVRIATHFEDLNTPIQNNIVNELDVYVEKVVWCSSTYNAGGVVGTTYGSSSGPNSVYNSDVDILSVYDDDAGSDDLKYGTGGIDWGAVVGYVGCNVLTAVLTAGNSIWITGIGYALELGYDLFGPDLTTTAYPPRCCVPFIRCLSVSLLAYPK